MDTDQVLALVKEAAAAAITPRFRSLAEGQVLEKKPGDLVTVADREAEVLISRPLASAYPGSVILGEEAHSADPGLLRRFMEADHAFTVDPVDGTKNFVHGNPDYAVMVSEVRAGVAIRAWIWQPEHEVAWVAEKGAGVWRNEVRMHRAPLGDEVPIRGVTSIWSMRGHALEGLPPLAGSWVCCGVDYARLIEGATDYLLYSRSLAWDHVPGSLMVAEAGGQCGHPDGTPYVPRSNRPGMIAAADPRTFGVVWRLLAADDISLGGARR
jgi:fructose-1,6-bisphosphatase/inositol monophosphatase family enzyme